MLSETERQVREELVTRFGSRNQDMPIKRKSFAFWNCFHLIFESKDDLF